MRENSRPGRGKVRWEMMSPELGARAVRLRRGQDRVQGAMGQGSVTNGLGVGQRREKG